MEFDEREASTILAALRLWQETKNREETDIYDAYSEQGEIKLLDDIEIDDLCERINCGEADRHLCDDDCRGNGCKEAHR